MPARRPTSVRLPQSLRDEIDAQNVADSSGSGRRRLTGSADRKTERKAERQRAKQKRAQFFSKGTGQVGIKGRADVETDGSACKKRKLDPSVTLEPEARKTIRPTENTHPDRIKKKAEAPEKEPGDGDWMIVKDRWSRKEEEEDAYMSILEKRLGVNKRKSGRNRYGDGFEGDGLLDLLLDLDEKILDEGEREGFSRETVDDDDEEYESSASFASVNSETSPGGGDENEWTGFTPEDDHTESESTVSISVEQVASNDEVKRQNLESRYIPPHLRKQLDTSDKNGLEVDVKLARLLKGLLNRMSEQNIDSILKEIEGLYRSHRRHDITSTLTKLIIEGTCSHSSLLDSYVALHAGLVACLHKIIGIELAAHFVQTVVATFEGHYARYSEMPAPNANVELSSTDEPLGKECSNLLVLLSDLYNYRVISCALMYDVIRLILEGDMTELDVELVLKLARGSGNQLRQDDPSALKDIIQIVQAKLGDQSNASSRTRFMVETLNNLKNNKLKKNASAGQGTGESKDRISKFVAGIGKKYHVHAHEPLRISLDDLHQADSKGKWWLVGAAWGGDPLVEQHAPQEQTSSNPASEDIENVLLKLARKQGMNTDVRRSIFVVLMSSDDYVDACDRLAQLNLTDVQQREIMRVLLHCCGNEQSYNPYYTLIGQYLCRQSHSHRVTLQYCFWDFLRSLGETNIGGAEMAKSLEDENDENEGFNLDRVSSTRMENVARAYAWWIARDCVAITVLKTLDFVSLKSKTQTFLRQFFTQLFICTQDPSPVPNLSSSANSHVLARRDSKALGDVLLKAARVPVLMQGIVHFLSSAFRRIDTQNKDMDEFVWWGCDAAKGALRSALETGGLY
ncbi:hypothetical protein DFH11DRAFT_1570916 [Phellopilus nigrolimitatus]|nr:hypothetical protein DFH11DRAFT_1570916 [Phellopilus nigrolimitatus]